MLQNNATFTAQTKETLATTKRFHVAPDKSTYLFMTFKQAPYCSEFKRSSVTVGVSDTKELRTDTVSSS